MKEQTKFYILQGSIIGLILHHHKRRWKSCKWCGHTFMPHHNKQAFCDNTCRQISRQSYKSSWNYHRRVLERNGDIVNDRSILNVGTGGLSEHPSLDMREEYNKIRKELSDLGIRSR